MKMLCRLHQKGASIKYFSWTRHEARLGGRGQLELDRTWNEVLEILMLDLNISDESSMVHPLI